MIFNAIYKNCKNPSNGKIPRFFMMVGDQIYADTLNRAIPLARADTEKEFHERYLTAFGAPFTRRVLQNIPTYMILDDHEIEDNWVQSRIKDQSKRALFLMAITAYMSYQWSHCPRNYGKSLFYSFEYAGFPFFVLDGRTQRIQNGASEDTILEDNHILGYPAKSTLSPTGKVYKGQIDIVCDWLIQQQKVLGNRPKFVVSASVFVPNTVASARTKKDKIADDSWAAFPTTRKTLLKTIVDNKIQNVIFLSGDIHCSNVAEMSFYDQGTLMDLKAFSITSSAFYWPFPFADGNPLDYVHDSQEEKDGFDLDDNIVMHYKSWNFQQDDNYTQVNVDLNSNTIEIESFNKKGMGLDKSIFTLAT